jgi:UDP-N-acetylglucosamine 4,6-dehydratase/5-epimerase
MLKNSTLLITGGTGSFGNAALKKFLNTGVKKIRIFSRDEKKQDDMRQHYDNDKVKYYIGDVRDTDSINHAIRGVDFVLHAAALKQVPSCEFFPMQAVMTNVKGCNNVLNASIENKIKTVLLLSTDKAVYPISVMGMTKALAEKVVIAKSRELINNGTLLACTRYGNFMASRGSVIPLFIDQIKSGKPVTITEPKMTRFMMTLDDAIELVNFAFQNAHQGDVFDRKAPATTVEVLAQALLELYSAKNEIKIIGVRHGEKIYETLVNREEMLRAENLGDYYRIPMNNGDLNYKKYLSEGEVKILEAEEYSSNNTHLLNLEETKNLLLKLNIIRKDVLGYKQEDIFEL